MNVTKKGKPSMGLAAGQARLLTITGRKSDCEYESMRLSHQKIALSRQLADLSNEYQNSIDQTKLIYDYYGTGDESNPLSYGILMSPSALNNYMPILVTDPKGRATLNEKYAAAAAAAGIPQEGLGTLPSENMRNKFIEALGIQGVISTKTAETILSLPYNQAAGVGGGTTVAVATQTGQLTDLTEYLKDNAANINLTLNSGINPDSSNIHLTVKSNTGDQAFPTSGSTNLTYNLGNLLSGSETLLIDIEAHKHGKYGEAQVTNGVMAMIDDVLDQVGGYFEDLFDLGDGVSKSALEYARASIQNLYAPESDSGGYDTGNTDKYFNWTGKDSRTGTNYIGWSGGGQNHTMFRESRATHQVDLGNMIKAYMTFLQDYINGVSKTKSDGTDLYYVNKGKMIDSRLVTEDTSYTYTWKTGSSVSSDDCAQATFYDALFNQICQNGWTCNKNIDDNDYLQEMLKSGMLFVSRVNDDGYYYQGNYATDTYIKEVSDDTKIAQAEAKYTTEKAKLNAKEETLDLKMKNLDTEISSLTTEYDTVKNTISKNIEKSFKRYNA